MVFLFIVNVIVVTLVAREFCQKTTEETPREKRALEEKKTSELPAVELKIEEELATEKSGQEVTQEIPSQTTETAERTRDSVADELVTEEEEDAKVSTTTEEEITKEDSRETTDEEPGKTLTDISHSQSGEEGNTDDSTKGKASGKKADMETISEGGFSPQEALSEDQGEKPEMDSEQKSKTFFELKAALTAMWLPAVVGDKKNLFLATSLSTLITKILILLVSVFLAYFFQEEIHPHPFIFWSGVGKMINCLLTDRSMNHPNIL